MKVEARHITKRFPGVLALDDVNLNILPGKVNALVGENGAGKSTLMNILSGVYQEYEGEIRIDGEVQHFQTITDAQTKGVAIIHQELNLIPYLTVAENIFLSREPKTRIGLVDYARMHRESKQLLERLHSNLDTNEKIANLRVGQQQIVEIAKALSLNAQVMIFDEPTSSLSDTETEALFRLIGQLKEKGVGIVYISHKMKEISQLADFVTILRDGKFIDEIPMADTNINAIVAKMVGRESNTESSSKSTSLGRTFCSTVPPLAIKHLSLKDEEHKGRYILRDISLEVKAGETLGIYGLMGAGRTELFETIFGMFPKQTEGDVLIDGKSVNIRHPQDAVRNGLALITEDRKATGLVLGMNIEQNTTLASLRDFLRFGLIHAKKEELTTEEYQKKLKIKSYSGKQLASQLSGGNQQKIVLSKWMLTHPRILLLDEPTRGIDINAKHEIYKLMRSLADEGMALIVVSSELPEIMAVSDRIITLRNGSIGKEFLQGEFSEEAILKASLPDED